MQTVGYFGFGSLVNRTTLRTSFVDVVPATLKNWRRHWQGRQTVGDADVALLSIHRAENTSIHGMLVIDRLENLPQVDEREIGYDRVAVTLDDLEISATYHQQNAYPLPEQLYVYVGKEPAQPNSDAPLLQSYTDAVMQGFHNEYGDSGLHHFIETTMHFDRTIIADRHEPRYPRAVQLPEDIALSYDNLLRAAGVRFSK